MPRESKIRSEVEVLWRATFGEEPKTGASSQVLLDALMEKIPAAQYTTLRRLGAVIPPERR